MWHNWVKHDLIVRREGGESTRWRDAPGGSGRLTSFSAKGRGSRALWQSSWRVYRWCRGLIRKGDVFAGHYNNAKTDYGWMPQQTLCKSHPNLWGSGIFVDLTRNDPKWSSLILTVLLKGLCGSTVLTTEQWSFIAGRWSTTDSNTNGGQKLLNEEGSTGSSYEAHSLAQ